MKIKERFQLIEEAYLFSFIEDTRLFLDRLGIEVPKPLDIPEELLGYAKRNIEIMTMEQFKANRKLPIFVKPHSKLKEFTAGVITREDSYRMFFNDVPDSSIVMTSDVIDIVGEYRGFVVNKELKSLSHYFGSFEVYPDCKIIKQAIQDYKEQPAGYSIDFGVTSSGETVLIECNDGWSLGAYGCSPKVYADLLLKRWLQMTKY